MKLCNLTLMAAALAVALGSCADKAPQLTKSGLDPQDFVAEHNGKATALYTLTNDNGMEVCVTNFGGRVVSIMVPDRDGNLRDVVLGFDSIADYLHMPSDFGASIGRYANRINGGVIEIDGQTYQLAKNDPHPAQGIAHTLHGGPTGWQYQVYDVEEVTPNTITLVMNSPDGDNGFPGNVVAKVVYTLTPDNKLDIAYEATTDAPTVINMTNHSYFNLNGDSETEITNHLMKVASSQITPVDSALIPTGEFVAVADTPFDFVEAHAIGERIDADNEQLGIAGGYDHNWVLDTNGDVAQQAITVVSPETGIVLNVYTDEPGIQIYTGNFLSGMRGKHGKVNAHRAGLCLESQHYPDSPNKADWPSVVLRPGEIYKSRLIYGFDVEK